MSYKAKSNIPILLLNKVGSPISTSTYNNLPEFHKGFYENNRPTTTPVYNSRIEDDEAIDSVYSNNISCDREDK